MRDSNNSRARSNRRLLEVGVALGEVVRRQEGAGHDPGVGDPLPLGRLICERGKHNARDPNQEPIGTREERGGAEKGGAALGRGEVRTGVAVDGGGHAAPGRRGARRQRPEAGSRRRQSHGWWCGGAAGAWGTGGE